MWLLDKTQQGLIKVVSQRKYLIAMQKKITCMINDIYDKVITSLIKVLD